jgi:hypothetical protein
VRGACWVAAREWVLGLDDELLEFEPVYLKNQWRDVDELTDGDDDGGEAGGGVGAHSGNSSTEGDPSC